jgi:hypothetical protein
MQIHRKAQHKKISSKKPAKLERLSTTDMLSAYPQDAKMAMA